MELLGDRLRLRVRQSPRRLLVVHVVAPLRDDELGVRAQQLQRERFAAASYSLDPNAVYLQSYTGQAATDSPRAIHDRLRVTHPELRLHWGVEDWSVPVPEGAVPVLIRSKQWYDVLGSAGSLVNNIDFDRWFVKRPGQRFLADVPRLPGQVDGPGAVARQATRAAADRGRAGPHRAQVGPDPHSVAGDGRALPARVRLRGPDPQRGLPPRRPAGLRLRRCRAGRDPTPAGHRTGAAGGALRADVPRPPVHRPPGRGARPPPGPGGRQRRCSAPTTCS